ncbi:MAG: hypothetical protein HPY66_2936 [Firmicutes bacterium]|nr:hypothetical protein [Bacillota bacterium]
MSVYCDRVQEESVPPGGVWVVKPREVIEHTVSCPIHGLNIRTRYAERTQGTRKRSSSLLP